MNKFWVIGNWKMNMQLSTSIDFCNILKKKLNFNDFLKKNIIVGICTPYIFLNDLNSKNFPFFIGAQNVYFENNGAFTGEISPLMLNEINVKTCIVGHSERRKFFGEDNLLINSKIIALLRNNITPILCIGETLVQYKNKETKFILEKQLTQCLYSLKLEEINKVIIAYEPIWAIGTSLPATPQYVDSIIQLIKDIISNIHKNFDFSQFSIIYGGSVNLINIEPFLKYSKINGFLIGAASLNVDNFLNMLQSIYKNII